MNTINPHISTKRSPWIKLYRRRSPQAHFPYTPGGILRKCSIEILRTPVHEILSQLPGILGIRRAD